MEELHIMITQKETALMRRIASRVYKTYCPAGEKGSVTRDELIHWGIVGLCESKQRFDKSLGIPFLKYAATRIEGEMIDNIRKAPMIRLPQDKQKKVKEMRTAREEIERTGATSDHETLAGKLGWSVDEVHEVLKLSPSISYEHEESRDDDEFKGLILKDESPNPEDLTIKKQRAEAVQKCLETLEARPDRFVLHRRFWLEITLAELSKVLACSIQQVSLIEKRALSLMMDCLERQGWVE